ncbi:MAG: hypothetical protein C4296_14550 [Gemmataceae bacterium]
MRIMRIAALVLGIIGGVWGLLLGVGVAFFVGPIAALFGDPFAGTVVYLGLALIPLGVLGLVGAALAPFRPKAAAWCMGISAVGHLIAISAALITVTALGASMSFIFIPPTLEIRGRTGRTAILSPIDIVAPLCLGVATVMAIAGRKEQKEVRL